MFNFWRRSRTAEPDGGTPDEELRKQAIRRTLVEHQGEGPERQAEALEEVMLAAPTQGTTDWLWKVCVVGLVAALVLSLCGLIVLAALDKSSDVLVTAFTSIVTGLLGLFIPSPAEGSS
jgi:di/tricarboxylate transporter